MTTANQDNEFIAALISRDLLEEAISWIAKNLNPEDVFDRRTLEAWANDNGYEESE